MSKLLISEPPLQVLPTLAKVIGLNKAIVLQQIHYWLTIPKIGKTDDQGVKWVRNSIPEWQKDNFSFWSKKTVKRILDGLVSDGLIKWTDRLNSFKQDRTRWYTVNYELLNSIETSGQLVTPPKKKDNLSPASGQPVAPQKDKLSPTLPETTIKTTTDISPPGEKSLSILVTDLPGPPKIKEITKLPDASDPPDDFADLTTPSPIVAKSPSNDKPLSESEIAHLCTIGKLPGDIPPEYDIIQEIQAAHWDKLTTNQLRAISLYVLAVRRKLPDFAIPNDNWRRDNWKTAVKGHLKDYRIDALGGMYQTAVDKLAEIKFSFTQPKSLTNMLPDISNEPTAVQETFDLSQHKIVPPTPVDIPPVKSTLTPQQIDAQFAKAREAMKNAKD